MVAQPTAVSGEITSQKINDWHAYFESEKVGKSWMSFVNVMDYGVVGDGVADDTVAIQTAIDALPPTGGQVIVPIGTYNISSTITFSDAPIEFVGIGGFKDDTSSGTRFHWVGATGQSAFKLNSFVKMRNIFVYNPNGTPSCTAIDGWYASPSTFSRVNLTNVMVKGFETGLALQNTFYDQFYNVYISYCTNGIKTGAGFNNSAFYSCHLNHCDKGVYAADISMQIDWISCSFENSTTVGIDLAAALHNWSFLGAYCEGNVQTIWCQGINCVFDNFFLNHETPPVGKACVEIQSSGRPMRFQNFRFSTDIPTTQGFAYTGVLSNSFSTIVIGHTYPAYYLSDFLYANMGLFENGIIDVSQSNITVIESEMYDASAAQITYVIPPNTNYNITRMKCVGVYLQAYGAIAVGTGMTIRFGNSGANYDQIVNETLATDQSAGLIPLTTTETEIFPDSYNYMINNTSGTSGKYKMVFVLAG